MRIFTLAAIAALAAAKVVPSPSPKITPANTTPDHAQATPEITPAPTHPPLFEAYRELLKRSSNATPAFKKSSEAPCPVDCGNGFCCPLNQKCFSEKGSENQVSMQCGYPELRKRQNTDLDSILSSIYAYTNTAGFSAYYSSLLSEIYAWTTDPYYSSIFADPYYSSMLASLTRTDYDYGTRTRGSTSQETDPGSYSYSYSRKKKKSPVGAIVGGVIGGLLFLALIAGIIFFVINRNKKTPPTSQAFVSQQAQAPKPEANYPLQTQTPAPAPVPEKAFYQLAQPAVPGAIEADGTQAVAPQYTGNSQQYPQQPIQQQYPQQPVQQQQYPQQPMQQQQYPQQPIQQQQYPQQQQQQNFQQPGAVYHEVHNTSSPPPPPPVSPPPQQQYATPIPQSGTVYHEMGTNR